MKKAQTMLVIFNGENLIWNLFNRFKRLKFAGAGEARWGGAVPRPPAAGLSPARPSPPPGPVPEAPRLLRTRKKQPARGDRSGRKRQ